ncbi:hypothetical protein Ct61P_01364 [Colletotrichum tofieldiae]|nr:hypothetical protein Ct61P_01364 [Colletotrichum tofieldiae]
MNTEDENLGPLVRLWGLRTEQLPAPGATTADLAPFLIAVLQEAVPFIDAVAPKDGTARPNEWKAKGTKTFPESTAPVELYERIIPAAELEKEAARNQLPNGNSASTETWACRRSVHKDRPGKGTAAWEEFIKCFKDDHVEAEKAFTPNVMEAREALVWDCKGVVVDEGGFRGRLQGRRVGDQAQARDAAQEPRVPRAHSLGQGEGADEFVVVSIPVLDLAGSDHGQLVKDKGVVVGAYVSVERVRKLPTGAIEWIMATASDAKGALPAWIQAKAVLGVVAKDVALFLGWIAEEREKGTSVGKWTSIKGGGEVRPGSNNTLEDAESSNMQGRTSRQGVSSRNGMEPALGGTNGMNGQVHV